MKTKMIFFLPLCIFFLWSCEKKEMETFEEVSLSLVLPASSGALEEQEIVVQVTTGTPCYSIEVVKTVVDNNFEYNFILTKVDIACIQVIKVHDIPVVFDPPSVGTYTLDFLIDGKLQETREIVVTEFSIVGTWQVLHIENETQNTVISAPEDEVIVIRFGSSSMDGTTKRNQFQGEYQVHPKNEIFITDYVTTEQEETDFGKIFYEVMTIGQIQTLPFEVDENLLRINYEDDQYMILSRQ